MVKTVFPDPKHDAYKIIAVKTESKASKLIPGLMKWFSIIVPWNIFLPVFLDELLNERQTVFSSAAITISLPG